MFLIPIIGRVPKFNICCCCCLGDGRVCIRFGMVSADTDVEELLSLVVRTGTELDEQVKLFFNIYIFEY